MTIVLGTAVADTNGANRVYLPAPVGFATGRGIRLSNFTGDTLILTGIDGSNPTSQQYLSPQTQMVYPSVNQGLIPWVQGYAYPPNQIADSLLVEWSTEPLVDFIGTYPTPLPSTGISSVSSAANIYPSTVLPNGTTNVPVNVSGYKAVIVKWKGTGSAGQQVYPWLHVNEPGGADVWVISQGGVGETSGPGLWEVDIPIRLVGTSPIINVGMTNVLTGTTVTLEVIEATNLPTNLPYSYTDMIDGIYFTVDIPYNASGFPHSYQMLDSKGSDAPLYMQHVGECYTQVSVTQGVADSALAVTGGIFTGIPSLGDGAVGNLLTDLSTLGEYIVAPPIAGGQTVNVKTSPTTVKNLGLWAPPQSGVGNPGGPLLLVIETLTPQPRSSDTLFYQWLFQTRELYVTSIMTP